MAGADQLLVSLGEPAADFSEEETSAADFGGWRNERSTASFGSASSPQRRRRGGEGDEGPTALADVTRFRPIALLAKEVRRLETATGQAPPGYDGVVSRRRGSGLDRTLIQIS